MKKIVSLSVLVMAMGAASFANAAESCAAKEAQLQKQIGYAQAHGNYQEVLGLKKALAEVKMHCTESSVRQDTLKKVNKLQEKIADKQGDIREVQADLRKAQMKGDMKKVAKYQKKLAEKQADLQKLQAELAALKG